MRKPRPKATATASTPLAGRLAASQWTLPVTGLVVLAAILGGVYAWPTGDVMPPPISQEQPLVLPSEPDNVPVAAIRAEAEQAVSRLIERFPTATQAWHAAAMLYHFLNQHEQAIAYWKKSIELDPQDGVAYEWLAKMQVRRGEDAEAARTLEQAIERQVAGVEILREYSVILQRQGELEQAVQVARQALAASPEHRDLWVTMGQAQMQLGQLGEARASFEEALRLDATSETAHFGAANACQRLGDTQQAAYHRRQVESLHKASLRKQLPFDEDYNRSLRSTVATILSAAAGCYKDAGEADEAERLCLRACAIDPSNPSPYRELANLYHQDGNFERALAVQERLMDVEAENPANAINFASLSFQLGRLEQGEEALLRAVERFPESGLVLEALALVYLRRGEPAQARPYVERAIEAGPTHERYELLAQVCRSLGDSAAAEPAERAAQTLAPTPQP